MTEDRPIDIATPSRQVRSFCRFCSALCGVVLTLEGDTVTEVRGDPEHPYTRGYTCPKGRALGAWHHHPLRLDEPQIGRGDERRNVSWDEALDDLAARLDAVRSEHGPDSVGMFMSTAMSFDALGGRIAHKLFQSFGSRSRYTAVTIDTPCRPIVSDLMGGNSGLMPCIDHDTAGLTLFVGTNPIVSHGHTTSMPDPVNRVRALATAPRELWVVDPRRTETARLATRHLSPKPGSDHAFLAHLVRELLGPDGGADRDYLARHAIGVDELTAAVAPYDRTRAVAETGLDGTDLDDLLAAIRRHGRIAALSGTGTTMAASATASEWLLWSLGVITGSYEQPGGLWFNPGFLRCFDRRDLRPSPPERLDFPRPPSRPDLPGFYGEYPCAAMVDEIEAGNLRALVVIGGNPVTALPDAERLDAALASLEVLATIDVIETETTALSTHVLPSAGQLERADVPDYVDQYYPAVASHYTPAVMPLGGDRKPVWWISAALAGRDGHDILPGGMALDEATDDALLDALCNRGRLPLDDLRASPTAVEAEGAVRGWVHDRVLPEGRWRLAPAELVAELAALSTPETTPSDRPLTLVPRRLLRNMNSQLRDAGAPGGRLEQPYILVHPLDAARFGIADGAEVVVQSEFGETAGVARVDDGIRPGVISVPHGYSGTRIGALTTGERADHFTGMVRQSGLAVSIAPTPTAPATIG
jgi:anaerobic selenocysteine-containing dehydrogenase